ncbi:MAG: tetratricopeptide repeat protein [Rhodospirillales bacterium]
MSTPSKTDKHSLLAAGLERFQSGRLPEAERLFRQVLEVDPDDPDGLHLLGLCHQQAGRSDEAVEHIEKAIAAAGANAIYLNNLGQIYAGQGDFAEAAASYRRALETDPASPQIHNNLGNALAKLEDADGAARHYRRAINADAGYAVAHYNLGNLYLEDENLDQAITCFDRVLEINPGYAEAHNNRGKALEKQNRLDQALECYLKALDLDPKFVKAANNLGNVQSKQGNLEAARETYQRAIEIDPNDPEAYTNLGTILSAFGEIEEAVALHEKAIGIDPELAPAHHNLGVILLRKGELAKGWPEYEWRWRTEGGSNKKYMYLQPRWNGEPLEGKSILVWSEQGVGDEVMFAGMVPDLVEAGARVLIECDIRLVPLFKRSFPDVKCIPRTTVPAVEIFRDDIDFQVPAGNLGRWFRPGFESFPRRPAYLGADDAKRQTLRKRSNEGTGDFLIGVAWFSKNERFGELKSMSLMDWKPVADVRGVRFVDLQYGETAAEREAVEAETGFRIFHDETVDQMADLDSFAAQVAAMDLVVTVSNTTAHMAGALGVPTWVMLNTIPLPCWMLDREDSPWYPSVRLFRQTRRREWDDVVDRVAGALKALVEGGAA